MSSATKTRHIFTLHFKGSEFSCLINPQDRKAMVVNKTSKDQPLFTSIPELINAYPWLINQAKLIKLAKLANFLLHGLKYEVIEKPAKFKKQYKDLIESENEFFEPSIISVLEYGVFDVSQICEPCLENDSGEKETLILLFYATMNLVPYKVHCEFSPSKRTCKTEYELLPYA